MEETTTTTTAAPAAASAAATGATIATDAAVTPPKSLQELAMEGQAALEATVEAAHESLSSMNEVLCNPALWSPAAAMASPASASMPPTATSASQAGANAAPPEAGSHRTALAEQEAGWAALDESRLHLRTSTSSLRSIITAIFNSPELRNQEELSNGAIEKSDPTELEKLEKRVAGLREEVLNKNKVMKVLINQLRDFISDISMWQSPSI